MNPQTQCKETHVRKHIKIEWKIVNVLYAIWIYIKNDIIKIKEIELEFDAT